MARLVDDLDTLIQVKRSCPVLLSATKIEPSPLGAVSIASEQILGCCRFLNGQGSVCNSTASATGHSHISPTTLHHSSISLPDSKQPRFINGRYLYCFSPPKLSHEMHDAKGGVFHFCFSLSSPAYVLCPAQHKQHHRHLFVSTLFVHFSTCSALW